MYNIDDKFLDELGLSSLTGEEREAFKEYVNDTLQERIGDRLTKGMSDETLDEFAYFMDGNIDEMKKWLSKHMSGYENDPNFQKFKDSNPEASESDILSSYGSVAWLQFNCPNYLDIVNNAIKEMRDEITKNRDVILKGSLGEAAA